MAELHITMDDEARRRIDDLSKRLNVPRSGLITEAVRMFERWLAGAPTPTPESDGGRRSRPHEATPLAGEEAES